MVDTETAAETAAETEQRASAYVSRKRMWRTPPGPSSGSGVYRSHRGYRGVAVPAADWLRRLQEVRWIFSPRV